MDYKFDKNNIFGTHIFPNKRKYKVTDTDVPWKGGEIPSGGILIEAYEPHYDTWTLIGYYEHVPHALIFLEMAVSFAPITAPKQRRSPHWNNRNTAPRTV